MPDIIAAAAAMGTATATAATTASSTFLRQPLLFLLLLLSLLSCCSGSTKASDYRADGEKDDGNIRPMNFFLTEDDKESVRKNLICHGWPCPKFQVISDPSRLVQERLYPAMDVVTASADGCLNLTMALLTTYMKLFRYRHGDNNKKIVLKMSVPVVAKITQDKSSPCNRTFELWFYVNATEIRTGIPKPIEVDMKVKKIKKMDVYVGTRGSKSTELDDVKALVHEDVGLVNNKICYNNNSVMVALYDTPWKKRGRRTEVWLEKTSC